MIIAGESNVYVGLKRPYEAFIGPNSLEKWNEARERSASFCGTCYFYHGNSCSQKEKNRRWTYVKPNGVHKNELDHILCKCKLFTDAAVLPSFQTRSGHRMLRAKFHSNNIKAMLNRMAHRRLPPTILEADTGERVAEMHDFEELSSIEEDFYKLVAAITTHQGWLQKKETEPHHLEDHGRNTTTVREEKESEELYP
ncbi:hypothetical protein Y032_0522g2899 [Ancylostoma ceylanicum]|uniref:Uncharacterized protein n=1 Tax=Ancylostoma ceylanicum TaxID=53326 RepID=A0A016WSQ0_9BILA|nr:hypothetical protein Y032_0522g2899 [Ancylostoma ceylanicum]